MQIQAMEYISQARRNAEVADRLRASEGGSAPISLQWAVVCMFYAAIHYVNAYLQHTARPIPANHGDREQYAYDYMTRHVHNALRELRSHGHDVRYKLSQPTPDDCARSQQKLQTIESFVRQNLGALWV